MAFDTVYPLLSALLVTYFVGLRLVSLHTVNDLSRVLLV
jgi:hypothetical protein